MKSLSIQSYFYQRGTNSRIHQTYSFLLKKNRLVYKTKMKQKSKNYSADSLSIDTKMWQKYNWVLTCESRVLA